MTVAPVLFRELLVQARQPATYALRVIATLALAAGVWLSVATLRSYTSWDGRPLPGTAQVFGTALFGNLNLAMFVALWLVVPLLLADAISRERREGTLGLLLLTPLRPGGVIVGKMTAHVLRALTLYLTMLPWLMVPLLLGGVSWSDVAMAALINLSVLFLVLAAGLLASCWSDDWVRNAIAAEVMALALVIAFLGYNRMGFEHATRAFAPPAVPGGAWTATVAAWGGNGEALYGQGLFSGLRRVLAFATNNQMEIGFGPTGQASSVTSGWGQIWTNYPAVAHARWFGWTFGLLGAAMATFGVASVLASRRVAASWREAPRGLADGRLGRSLFAPRFALALFRSRMTRALERNPIGWLQQRTPQARLIKWGWCVVIMLLVVIMSVDVFDLPMALRGLQVLLLMSLALSATGSFRHERESGAFELLLVTPLTVDQVVAGRLRGLWMQFLPAAVILTLAGAYVGTIGEIASSESALNPVWQAVSFGIAFVGVSVVGLCLSARRLPYLTAWMLTGFAVLVLPYLPSLIFPPPVLSAVGSEPALGGWAWRSWLGNAGFIGVWRILLAVSAWLLLRRHLAKRHFALR